jgi:16S rRNA (guanine527-N7)-methyltransferase
VKHCVTPQMQDELREQLALLGLDVRESDQDRALSFLLAILKANEQINLTRITVVDEAIRLHLVDSLAALPELGLSPDGPVLDLGSGGGFPGVPLAIASARRVVLLDSVTKKGTAVAGVLAGLRDEEFRVAVESGRAEEFALNHAGEFAAVLARAVAPLPALVELASPLLMTGGTLIALKGCPDPAERASGAAAARVVGMRETNWRQFELPNGGETRVIVMYTRIGEPKIRLPRRIGLAQHSPLA